GADHPYTLSTLAGLAQAYQVAGNLEQALPLFQQAAVGIAKRQFVHPHAGPIVGALIACHEQLKQDGQAEAWRRKWLAGVQGPGGPQSAAYAAALALLGLNLLRQQKHAEAEQALRACLPLRARLQPDAWTTFNVKSMLGDALLGQKQYAAAEPLLVEGYEGLKQREAKIPPQGKVRLTEALERLVRLYDAWGRKDQAAQRRKETEAPQPPPR